MLIELRKQPFNAYREMIDYQANQDFTGQYGATASFTGSMRDFNEDKKIIHMTLEHYPGMTEQYLNTIANKAMAKWQLLDIIILHRIGQVTVGEDIVFVATWSAHRKEAFESCRMIIEQLKSSAPFWKKEQTRTGARWVEHNTSGF